MATQNRFNLYMNLLVCSQMYIFCAMGQECSNISISHLLCNNNIPKDLADTVESVDLIDINPAKIHISKETFTGKGWPCIKRLTITTLDAPYGWIKLNEVGTFSSLLSLQSLSLRTPTLDYIGNQTFYGLNNLTEFELTGCKSLSIYYLLQILQNKNLMPNLNILKIDGLNEMGKNPVPVNNFENQFFQALAIRNITELYATNMVIGTIDLTSLILVCDTLKVFDVSGTYFVHFIGTQTPCHSLRDMVLDFMETQSQWDNFSFENIPPVPIELYDKFYFFKDVVNLSFNNFFTDETVIENSYFNILSKMEFNFKEMSLQNNLLNYIDVEVRADSIFKNLEKLEMQSNSLGYLNGGIFKSFISLKMLNMSNNYLCAMQIYNISDFENMLYHLKSLQSFDLSSNDLTSLPKNMFKNNLHLSHLYLANNKIEQIALISSFTLSMIDLQSNDITYLDKESRQWFDDKFDSVNQTDSVFFANIYGNPFQCLCKYQTFLQWIVHTSLVGNSSQYITCSDHELDRITVQLTKELNEDCTHAKRLKDIAIASSICFVVVVTTAVSFLVVYLRRRIKLRRKRTKEEIVTQIQVNTYHLQYPVFISYSTQDVDLVLGRIYPEFVDRLRHMFDTPRDLVCIGDRHFRPGRTIYEEIDTCLNKSAVVICVVSQQFCQSNFCKYELEQAHSLNKQIMLLFIEEVEEMNMPPFIRQQFNKYTRINLRYQDGEIIITPKWEIICESILDFLAK